jgi:hypothetical protein
MGKQKSIASCIDPAEGGHFVFFRGEYKKLPIAIVPEGLLLYRPENGRLTMQLRELEQSQNLQPGYFAANRESPEVQKQLHLILLEMSKNPQGPIYQELGRQAQQTELLLVTADGIVVNGNRRLAAMRALLYKDPDQYGKFQNVRAAVLPVDASPEDIEYVEAALQLAPETKLAYSWINRRLKLRRQRFDLSLPVSRILESYRLESQADLDRELSELAMAEDYLENTLGRPGHYALIEDSEKLFSGLHSNLCQLPENDRCLWRLAGFDMILARDKIDADLCAYFPFAAPKPAHIPVRVLFRLAAEEELLSEQQLKQESDLPESTRRQLAAVLFRTAEAPRLTRIILDILDHLQIEHREQNAPKRTLKRIQQARQLIENLEPETLTSNQRARIGSELSAIVYHGRRLLEGDPSTPPLVGGFAERAKGLNPDDPSFTAGLAHAFRAIIGRRLSGWVGSFFGK